MYKRRACKVCFNPRVEMLTLFLNPTIAKFAESVNNESGVLYGLLFIFDATND